VDGVLAPLARGEGGKTNNVCVTDGVGNTELTAAGWDASDVGTPGSTVLIGKGTKEESLADRRRDREDDVDDIMLGDAEKTDEGWEGETR
jgi:hypothetical protein